MKKLLIFIFIGLMSLSAQADMDARRAKLLGVLKEELSEVKRLSNQVGNRNPNVLLRIAEIHLEQARITREIENQKFLKLSAKKRRSVNKEPYFRKSKNYYKKAQSMGNFILDNFRTFKGRGDVYYILAFNAKEFGNNDKARKFLQNSVKFSRKGSEVDTKARLALAEIYYNERSYNKAIPLYKYALKKSKRSRWWTKDSYNLAWCYFRAGSKNKAISKMKEVYMASRSTSYVDMRNNIERDLAYFYADSGKTKSAIKFYKRNGKNVSKNLMQIGKNLINQGKYTSAERVLVESLTHKTSESDTIETHIMLLNLYDRFAKYEKHLNSSKILQRYFEENKLSSKQAKNLKFHVKKMSAILQNQVTSKSYKHSKKVRDHRAKMAVEYFSILSTFNKSKGYKDLFLAAETQYANGKYEGAAAMYDSVITKAQLAKDAKYETKALEGLMASLGKGSVSLGVQDRYIERGLKLSLKRAPRSKSSFKIYQRLFNIYLDKKNITGAESVLMSFRKNFPRSYGTQEAMLGKIMDHYKDNKDYEGIKRWSKRIDKGQFKVSKKYAEKVRLLVLTMEFEDVEKASNKGDKKKALKGYVEIYRAKGSSKEAKKNAAYNIAILFHELGDTDRTYKWSVRALSHMGSKDVAKFQGEFLSITTEIFGRQRFKQSLDLYKRVLAKLCRVRSKNKKVFFKNAAIVALSDKNFSGVRALIAKGKTCNVENSYITDVEIDYLTILRDSGKLSEYEKRINDLAANKKNWARLITPLGYLARDYSRTGRKSDLIATNRRIVKYYAYAEKKGQDLSLEGLDFVAQKKVSDLRGEISRLERVKLRFPEKKFNATLKRKFKMLDVITTKALALLAMGSGKGIVESYYYLSKAYTNFSDEISSFRPPGKSPSYIKSFQGSMREIASPLNNKANEFKKEARKEIVSSQILSRFNSYFLGSNDLEIPVEFYLRRSGVLMDRGGSK